MDEESRERVGRECRLRIFAVIGSRWKDEAATETI